MARRNSFEQGGFQRFVKRIFNGTKQPKAITGLPTKVSETLVEIAQDDVETVLKSLDLINFKVQEIVDEVTEPWGIAVERVETKDVEIPPTMQRAMAKEAEAIR